MRKQTAYKFSKEESLEIMEALQDHINKDIHFDKTYSEGGMFGVNKIIQKHTDNTILEEFTSKFEITIKAIEED